MEELIRHLVEPAVSNPEAVQVSAVEGEDVVLLKLSVDAADRGIFDEDGDRTLRSIRTIVSAAAGSNKASVELVSDDEQAEDAGDDAPEADDAE
ncbi:MAG: KH domain-containing protein [Proteobacteria bacterium]|nr:KH domain-containing protein [Pseudomonadota bacterium]